MKNFILSFLALYVLQTSSCTGINNSSEFTGNASLESVTNVPWESGRIMAVHQKNDTAYFFAQNGTTYIWTSTERTPQVFPLKWVSGGYFSLLRDHEDLYVTDVNPRDSDSLIVYKLDLQKASAEVYLRFAQNIFTTPIWLGTVTGRLTLVSDNCAIARFYDSDRTMDVSYHSTTPCRASQVEQMDDSTLVLRENSRIVVTFHIPSSGQPMILDTLYTSVDSTDYIALYKDKDNVVKGLFGDSAYRIQGNQVIPLGGLPWSVGDGHGVNTVPVTIGDKSFVCNENLVLSDSNSQFHSYKVVTDLHGFYGTTSNLCFSLKGELFYPVQDTIYRVVLGKSD